MVVGLETGKKFMLVLMVLGVIAFASIVVLQSITDTPVAATSGTGSSINETLTTVDEIGESLSISGLPSATCSVTTVLNSTIPKTIIASTNYTVTGCVIAFTGADSQWNNTDWDVTYTYTYNRIQGINANISGGIDSFFSNAGTWFALLAIVIIILVVVIVMKSVNSIGGSKSGGL